MAGGSVEPVAKKSLGQHWLHDESSLLNMVQAARVQPEDTILEIGPGLGTLTNYLVKSAAQVIAVEFDSTLARQLKGRVQADNLKVVEQDILRFDFTSVPAPYKVVANIPYYLTSNLIRVLSETDNPPTAVALLIQKEVAERTTAGPGAMSILSITAQYYWETELGPMIAAELFTPPPKVDSQIITLTRRPTALFTNVDTKLFFRLVKAGFSQRRKTLLNSLSAGMQLSKDTTLALLQAATINPTTRAQALSLEDWHRLYLAYLAQT